MLDDLRKKQKGIIWAIAIIFVGSMAVAGIVEMFFPKPFVGKIYGKKVLLQEFDTLFRQNVQQHLAQNQEATMDDQTSKQLNDQTWNQLVSRRVMDRQLKRYRIRVRDREVVDKALNDPPQDIKTIPAFLTNNEFDFHKYLSVLNENEFFAEQLEDYIRQILPYEKLERKIKDQIRLTADSVRVDWIERNDRITARVIHFDWNRVETQEISEDEILAYYNKNKKDFRLEAARKYRYVTLPLEASEDDNARVLEEMHYIHNMLLEGADFGETAELYSQDTGSAANRGTLGFFGRGRMVSEFEEIAFSSEIGAMSEPFRSQFGWHIMLVTDKRENDQGDPEVEASHILMRVEPSERTRIDLRNKAEDIFDRANRIGLEKAVEEIELTTLETADFYKDTDFIPGIGRYPHLVNDAFSKRIGYLVEPIRMQDGSYLIAELSSRTNAHIQDVEQVTEVIRRELDREKRTALALEQALQFLNDHSEEDYFEMAEELGFRILEINNRLINQTITGLGMDRELKNNLFQHDSEEWTPLITTERGNFLGFISERHHPDMEIFENDLENLTNELRQRREQTHYSQWYQKVLEEAKAEDLRYLYYQF